MFGFRKARDTVMLEMLSRDAISSRVARPVLDARGLSLPDFLITVRAAPYRYGINGVDSVLKRPRNIDFCEIYAMQSDILKSERFLPMTALSLVSGFVTSKSRVRQFVLRGYWPSTAQL